MYDPTLIIGVASTAVAGLSLTSAAALKGWQGWLELKRLETQAGDGVPSPRLAGRIEVADLKERVRKLEAIASGVDL